MAALPFQVEFVMAERGYLIARALTPHDFRLVEGSTLGGHALDPRQLDLPRALSADGTPRKDLFAFRFKRREDAAHFEPGQVIELSGWHA